MGVKLSNFPSQEFDSRPAARRRVGTVQRLLGALQIALPQSCTLCRAPCAAALLCGPCAATLPCLERPCPRCALPLPAHGRCAACARLRPPWSCTLATWRYAFPVDHLLHELKYAGRLALADALGAGLAATVRLSNRAPPDLVVPLPLAAERQRERGFNQSALIARVGARHAGLRVGHALRRVRATAPQAGLALGARARNVRGAFAATRRLDGLRVAIVDDVMTTGATLAEATRAALAAGAVDVEAWVCARTLAVDVR